jgi:hypothetical protein
VIAAGLARGKRGANNCVFDRNYLISREFDFDGVKVGHGWGGRIRTSMCREKIHLFGTSRGFGFKRLGGDGCGPKGE